ncbi:sensor protein LytS [Companilactobacillus sp. RD055328]|uniref:sensor histidine kinase n=1 Tax=Companilactobacillus sp. RD055328 TaxID=2916634 RepID=UPI001FC8D13F|nr:sensor histidine kinase [Companilactobacillus sp. RD055328]GKQ42341.1 sensor protein LytS [Companilactobacillus sp. RD055328]
MLNLSLLMLERVGLVIVLAFLLVNIKPLRKLLFSHQSKLAKNQLILIFSIFAIVSNLTGIEIDQNNQIISTGLIFSLPSDFSIMNTRLLSITVSGIVGGPYVGSSVGLITGIHRVIQGDWSSWFYIPSSILIGALSGLLFKKQLTSKKGLLMTPAQGLKVGFLMESIQMLFILFFSPTKLELVKFIAVPMIFANTIGTFIFLAIIQMYLNQEQEIRAMQTHDVLSLADTTLPYLRNGLNSNSAIEVVKIIRRFTNFSAISITSTNKVLAYEGVGSDHHLLNEKLVTELSKRSINNNTVSVAYQKKEIGCSDPKCPLNAAIVVPLSVDNRIFGTLKMYFVDASMLTPVDVQLAEGLGSIFSSQIALGEAELQSKLVRDAEIKSLQAQINPHFFFNAVNTISAMIRKDSEKARELLIELSTYFRANLTGFRETEVTFEQERSHVDAYLVLEQTRFPKRYDVQFDIQVSPQVMLPPFTIQVLVENAIKHAFSDRKKDNKVLISVLKNHDQLQIKVIDNGLGIDIDKQDKLGKEVVDSQSGSGTALQNLNQRLIGLYGIDSQLQFETSSKGTVVTINIPFKEI